VAIIVANYTDLHYLDCAHRSFLSSGPFPFPSPSSLFPPDRRKSRKRARKGNFPSLDQGWHVTQRLIEAFFNVLSPFLFPLFPSFFSPPPPFSPLFPPLLRRQENGRSNDEKEARRAPRAEADGFLDPYPMIGPSSPPFSLFPLPPPPLLFSLPLLLNQWLQNPRLESEANLPRIFALLGTSAERSPPFFFLLFFGFFPLFFFPLLLITLA